MSDKHVFVTPQLTDDECVNDHGEPLARWIAERICAKCGEYLTSEKHIRARMEADDE